MTPQGLSSVPYRAIDTHDIRSIVSARSGPVPRRGPVSPSRSKHPGSPRELTHPVSINDEVEADSIGTGRRRLGDRRTPPRRLRGRTRRQRRNHHHRPCSFRWGCAVGAPSNGAGVAGVVPVLVEDEPWLSSFVDVRGSLPGAKSRMLTTRSARPRVLSTTSALRSSTV